MSAVSFRYLTHAFEFPSAVEPSWKAAVTRWYQLDAYAYGLAEAYAQWQPHDLPRPSLIVLASPAASNETDRQFAITGAISPSKFVHTLPNIRSSALCQVMNWAGPLLCVHRDPHTLQLALREATELCRPDQPTVWVLAVTHVGARYTVHGFFLRAEASRARGTFAVRAREGVKVASARGAPSTDTEFIAWLAAPAAGRESFILPSGHTVISPTDSNEESP